MKMSWFQEVLSPELLLLARGDVTGSSVGAGETQTAVDAHLTVLTLGTGEGGGEEETQQEGRGGDIAGEEEKEGGDKREEQEAERIGVEREKREEERGGSEKRIGE